MFREEMIAPCGLDCSLCSEAHKPQNACQGCTGPDENKPEFCSSRCTIIGCAVRKNENYRFCDECAQYPCEFMQERETRYQSQYVLTESPIENLACIRKHGMDEFLAAQKEKWTCRECGGVISVHTGVCGKCGKAYTSLP